MANPRRRRRSYAKRRPATRRRRRRNAGITSFTRQGNQNPLILSNPRRRRRRNPARLNMKTIFNKTLVFGGGAAMGYGVNQFALSNIENDWMRRAAQAVTAVAGSMMLRGELGAAFAGATLYPLIADVAMYTGLVAVPTEADLDELSADLEDALMEHGGMLEEGGDEELYIEDYDEVPEEVIW